MEDIKFIDILKTFSKAELREFEKFLASPFFTFGRDVNEFYFHLRKIYPGFNCTNYSKETIYSELKPCKPYADHIMRNIISAFYRSIEQFLTIKRLSASKVLSKKFYIDELLDRRLGRNAEIEIKRSEKLLNNNNDSGDNYYRRSFEIENQKIILNVQANRQDKIRESILKQGELLVNNFLEDAGINYINMLNNEANFNYDFSNSFLGEFLKKVNLQEFLDDMKNIQQIFENTELFEIYACILITLINKNEQEYYFRLKNLLIKNLKLFNRMEKYSLLVTLGTCTSLKAETVNREIFIRELFEIYRIRLTSRLYAYSDTQHMSNIFFLSLLKLGISLDEIDWLKKFVDENTGKLAPEQQEKIRNYSLAQIKFHEKDFNASLNYLRKVDFDLYTMKYEVRNLTAQVYYEMEDFEQIIYLTDSYKRFLVKNKFVSRYFREPNLEFIDILNELVKFRLSGNPKEKESLGVRIKNSGISQKKWFTEKFNELK